MEQGRVKQIQTICETDIVVCTLSADTLQTQTMIFWFGADTAQTQTPKLEKIADMSADTDNLVCLILDQVIN